MPEELQVKPSASKAKSKAKKKADVPTAPVEDRPYSGRQMMKRLKCGDRLLRIKRSQPDFKEWSQERDPDGVAWKYEKSQFVPLQVAQVDTSPDKAEPQPKPSSRTKSKTKQKQKTTNKTKKISVVQAPSLESKPLSGRALMKRLKCGDRLLRIKRSQPDFSTWSQQRDPDNIAWEYKDGEFFPLVVAKPEPEPKSSKKESESKPSKSKTKTKAKTQTKTQTKGKQSKKTSQKQKKEPVQAVTTEVQSLSGRQMMKRLKCGDRLLRIKRSQPDFIEWSQERDPDNVAWQYKEGKFFPLEITKPEPKSSKKESESKPSKSKAKTKTKAKTQTKGKQSKKTNQKSKKEPTKTVKVEVQSLSGRQMMKRLKCGDRLLRIRRSQADFSEWSKGRDPDGIAWQYQDGQFVPNMG